MSKIFPALIVLTLAWATGAAMVAVGVDRLFASWILGGLPAWSLPTLSFVISAFMALATGTSWGTMAIIFPLIMVPTYEVSNGDPIIFYATVAGILSGAVSGDHASPISDTTVLSALASDCKLLAHVSTQAPYALLCIIISILFGTVPIGRGAWPNYVGVLLGMAVVVGIVFLFCKPIINKTGSFDIFTELQLRCRGNEELEVLRMDTAEAFLSQGAKDSFDEDEDGEPKTLGADELEEVDEEAPLKDNSSTEMVDAELTEADPMSTDPSAPLVMDASVSDNEINT
jgi:hypothetical protein